MSSSLLYILRTGGVHHSAFSAEWSKTRRQPDRFCMGKPLPHQNRTSRDVRGGRADGTLCDFAPRRPPTSSTSPPSPPRWTSPPPGTSPPPSEVPYANGIMLRRSVVPSAAHLAVAVHLGRLEEWFYVSNKMKLESEWTFRPSIAPPSPDSPTVALTPRGHPTDRGIDAAAARSPVGL